MLHTYSDKNLLLYLFIILKGAYDFIVWHEYKIYVFISSSKTGYHQNNGVTLHAILINEITEKPESYDEPKFYEVKIQVSCSLQAIFPFNA